jgi:hypothetical protein
VGTDISGAQKELTAERYHDATIGINWDVLACHADMLFGDEPDTDQEREE